MPWTLHITEETKQSNKSAANDVKMDRSVLEEIEGK